MIPPAGLHSMSTFDPLEPAILQDALNEAENCGVNGSRRIQATLVAKPFSCFRRVLV
jgi:hypothetical protein